MHRLLPLCALLLTALATTLPAQDPTAYKIPIPDKIERATVTDDAGKLQWADLSKLEGEAKEQLRCPTCAGKKTQECPFCARLEHIEKCPECEHAPDEEKKPTTCRTCAGEGTLPDPLEKAPCPYARAVFSFIEFQKVLSENNDTASPGIWCPYLGKHVTQ